jgi:phenylpyruvate tautomerase PptA (4-oxalocrotonate tautomerase family)
MHLSNHLQTVANLQHLQAALAKEHLQKKQAAAADLTSLIVEILEEKENLKSQ